jgi:hypothetical protein
MLIQYLMGLRSRETMVCDTFRESQASYLEFRDVAQQCALRVSPDYKLAWQNVLKLQRLVKERQTMRFTYLLQTRDLDCSLFETLDGIAERLDAGWSEAEEIAVQECNAHYGGISLKIADIRSKWNPHALDESFQILEQDPKYRAARLALSDRAQEFAERMKR